MMFLNRSLIYFLGTAALVLGSHAASAADCSPIGAMLMAPAVNLDAAEAREGSLISPWALSSNIGLLKCADSISGNSKLLLSYLTTNLPVVPSLTVADGGVTYPVYRTNTPGVGVVVGIQSRCDSGWRALQPLASQSVGQPGGGDECSFARTANFADASVQEPSATQNLFNRTSVQIALVKTGPIGGGQIDLGGLLSVSGQVFQRDSSKIWQRLGASQSFPVPAQNPIMTSACKILLPDGGNIRLPTLPLTSLPEVGSTAGATAFKIQIVCSNASIVTHFRFTTPNRQSGNETLLANAADGNAAKGIAVQLLDDNQGGLPIHLDTNVPIPAQIGKLKSGQTTLDFRAQYYRALLSPFGPGNVKALAVFDITYH